MNTQSCFIELFDLTWDLEVDYVDADPGVINAPVEACYPPEPAEILEVRLVAIMYDQGYKEFHEDISEKLWSLHKQDVIEEIDELL